MLVYGWQPAYWKQFWPPLNGPGLIFFKLKCLFSNRLPVAGCFDVNLKISRGRPSQLLIRTAVGKIRVARSASIGLVCVLGQNPSHSPGFQWRNPTAICPGRKGKSKPAQAIGPSRQQHGCLGSLRLSHHMRFFVLSATSLAHSLSDKHVEFWLQSIKTSSRLDLDLALIGRCIYSDKIQPT